MRINALENTFMENALLQHELCPHALPKLGMDILFAKHPCMKLLHAYKYDCEHKYLSRFCGATPEK